MYFNNDQEDNLDDISSQWKVRRIKCMSIFVLQLFAIAIDENINSTLMQKYVKFAVKYNHDDTDSYEKMLKLSHVIAAIAFQISLARFADQTRKVKRLLLFCNLCSVVGNVTYSLPYGLLVLTAGQLIRGTGVAAYPIVIGEVMRSYVPRDLCRAISMCLTGTIIGQLLGPVMSAQFRHVHFESFGFQIRHANALSLTTAALFLVVLMLTVALASDLSLEFDLKAHYQDMADAARDAESEVCATDSESNADGASEKRTLFGNSSKEPPVTTSEKALKVLLELARNPITLAILWASFVYAHVGGLFLSQAAHLGRQKVNISKHYDSVINTLSVLTTGTTYLVVGSLGEKVGDISLVYAGYALTILCCACWLLMEFLTSDSSALLSLFIIYLAALNISSCGNISLQVLMGKLVPSNIQCFTEAFRLGFVIIGGNLAGLFGKFELSIPLLSGAILIALNVVTIAIVNMNYQYLADPKQIIQISSRKYY